MKKKRCQFLHDAGTFPGKCLDCGIKISDTPEDVMLKKVAALTLDQKQRILDLFYVGKNNIGNVAKSMNLESIVVAKVIIEQQEHFYLLRKIAK